MDIVWFKVFKTTSFSIPTTNDLYAIVSEHVLTSGIIYFFFYNEIYLLGNHYIRYLCTCYVKNCFIFIFSLQFPGGVPPPGLITSMAGMPGLPPSAASLPPRLDLPPSSMSLGNHLAGAPRPDHAAAAAAAASMAAAAAASQGPQGPGSAAAAAAAAAANSASNGPKSEVI